MSKSYGWFAEYWQSKKLGDKYKPMSPELQLEFFDCAMNAFAEGCIAFYRKNSAAKEDQQKQPLTAESTK